MRRVGLVLAIAAILGWIALAGAGNKPVEVKILGLPSCLHPGQALQLLVEVRMAPGVKITGPNPGQGLGLPTILRANPYSRWLRVGPAHMPPPTQGHYQGKITLSLPVEVERGAPPGAHELAISLEYQACQGDVCMLPEAWEKVLKLRVCPGYLRGTNQKHGSSAASGRASSR